MLVIFNDLFTKTVEIEIESERVTLVNFDLNETQELFKATTERFARTVDVPERTKIREHAMGYDKSRWLELAELGLLTVALPEELGGLDGSIIDLSIIAETFGKNNAIDPWMENGVFPLSLLSQDKTNAVLQELITGSKIAAVAFAEQNMRYLLKPSTTQASKTDDGYLLNGEKQLVMGGAMADYLLVTAVFNNEFSLFVIPTNTTGLTSQTYRLADGSLATAIVFNDCRLDKTALTDVSYKQFKNATIEMSVLCCAEMSGLSQRLLEQTLEYVKGREQFGVAIGSFQVIQHGLVDCYSRVEHIKSMLLSLQLHEHASDNQWQADVMGAKSFISEAAICVAEWAVQYHGAMGTTDEVCIGHSMKRIITLSRLFGDAAHNLNQYLECA